jgi:hypothetical protein
MRLQELMPRHGLPMYGILAAVFCCGPREAEAAAPTETLRAAIQDLAQTFGPRYPRSEEWLDRLNRLEPVLRGDTVAEADQREFERLRREALIANPLLTEQPVLFVVRQQYARDHHNTATFFPAAAREYNDGQFTPGGALKVIDFAQSGAVRTLLESPRGVVRDPDVHFDGSRIVFALRSDAADSYHLYEIQADGSGLRQLTQAQNVDDLDPFYLPDDGLAFSSTREPKYCMCNRHIMANLFRMGSDGANIHQVGKSTLFEGHGSLLPDGRILYDRWEYVDRNFGDAQALWTVNPDGTNHAVYWGNNTASPGAVLEGRAIPGTELVLCTFSSCHDRPWGALALLDRRLALDGPAAVVRTWPADAVRLVEERGHEIFDRFVQLPCKYEDPWPLSAKYFLCSRMTGQGEQMGLYLLDVFGNEVLLHSEAPGCYDPLPLAPRPRPPVVPLRRDFQRQPGQFYVQDVYRGTHMQGVQRGEVKWLRVVESPEKRFWTNPVWRGQGIEGPAMNWHDFNNKRILGTVPVNPDGSAWFTVPSEHYVYFQLLDKDGLMIQSMRSGVISQSGETTSCGGCHDERRSAPPVTPLVPAMAHDTVRGGAPAELADWYGPPRYFSYLQEVQPVFDKHCVGCHDYGQSAGQSLVLARDRDLVFNASYIELWRRGLIHVVGAGPPDTQPARSWGAPASRLVAALRSDALACGRTLDRESWDRIVTWIDLNAPYYPTYASAHPQNLAGRAPLDDAQVARLEELTGVPLRGLAGHDRTTGPQVSFDRPERSPCLERLDGPDGPRYREALGLIRLGQEELARHPEADMPGFVACATDQWREQKYAARQAAEGRNRRALQEGRKSYDEPAGENQ